MSRAKDILNGWTNYLVGSDQTTTDEAARRANICAACPVASYGLHTAILPDHKFAEIQGMFCDDKKGGCGCPLSPAVRSPGYDCPQNKW